MEREREGGMERDRLLVSSSSSSNRGVCDFILIHNEIAENVTELYETWIKIAGCVHSRPAGFSIVCETREQNIRQVLSETQTR